MTTRRRWWIVAGLTLAAALVLVVALLLRSRAPAADQWRASEVPIVSSPIRLEIRDVRATRHTESTSWVFTVICREPAGCLGTFDIAIAYRAGGNPRRVLVRADLDLGDGAAAECFRRKRGAERVEGVTGVVITDVGPVDQVPDL